MKLRKIISGGQTGADREGLFCASKLGIETGGTAPKGFCTEYGRDDGLPLYGLVESKSKGYPPRTRQNVKDADITVWFGNVGSPGFKCTDKACRDYSKPFSVNPDADTFRSFADQFEVINIAGNRESTNPSVKNLVRAAFEGLKND